MTLRDAVAQLELLPDEHTIYATRINGQWLAGSTAFVREPPDDDRIQQVFDSMGTEYLLEVWLAKEVAQVYREHHQRPEPTVEETMDAIVYYAEHDSYLPRPDEE